MLFSVYSRGAAWGSCSVRTIETFSKEMRLAEFNGAEAAKGTHFDPHDTKVTPGVRQRHDGRLARAATVGSTRCHADRVERPPIGEPL